MTDLKEAIKAKGQNTFANVDPYELKLWKVKCPNNGDDDNYLLELQDKDQLQFMEEKKFRNTFQIHLTRDEFMS
jgi:hypothetical protein